MAAALDARPSIESHAQILRFTIRALLWLMVVVGLAVGSGLDHHLSQSQMQTLLAILLRNEITVTLQRGDVRSVNAPITRGPWSYQTAYPNPPIP